MSQPIPPADPATPPATDPAAAAPPANPAAEPPKPGPPAPAPPAEDSDAKIARLEAEVKAARAEAGKDRVTSKQNAADAAEKALAQKIGVALGLVKDEPVDPAKLTEQLTAAGAQAKQAQVELAVYRAAATTEADPAALLDSRSFLDSVKGIEPNDAKAIAAAIAAAVTANPRLSKTPAAVQAPGMRPNPAQGASASPPMGVSEQIAAAQKAGNKVEVMRLKSAQLLQTNT